MTKAIKKWVQVASVVIMLAVVLGMVPIHAMANEAVTTDTDRSISASYSGSFSSPWKLSRSKGSASLVYGYNTLFINEDYAWAYHTSLLHWAELKNTDWHNGPMATAGNVSKCEVTHEGTYVSYYCMWG